MQRGDTALVEGIGLGLQQKLVDAGSPAWNSVQQRIDALAYQTSAAGAIIRSQVEYSGVTQTVILRCLLEKAATGQRRGFADVDALLIALRAELMDLQSQILPPDAPNPKNAADTGNTTVAPDATPLASDPPPTHADPPYRPKADIRE